MVIEKGEIKRISLEIPWASLGSSPVRVVVEGIYIQTSAIDVDIASLDILRHYEEEIKTRKLQSAEDAAYNSFQQSSFDSDTSKLSYFQQLAVNIVNNLEVRVSQIHLRHRDELSTSKPFVMGLLLRNMLLQTTDEHWSPQFVDTNNKKSVFKLGKVEDFSLYVNAESLPEMPYDQWLQEMESPYRQKPTSPILPFANLTMYLQVNSKHSDSIPKIDINFSASEFVFSVSAEQYLQINAALKTISDFDRKMKIRLVRPSLRPSQDAKAWWMYTRWRLTGKMSSYENAVSAVFLMMKSIALIFPNRSTWRPSSPAPG